MLHWHHSNTRRHCLWSLANGSRIFRMLIIAWSTTAQWKLICPMPLVTYHFGGTRSSLEVMVLSHATRYEKGGRDWINSVKLVANLVRNITTLNSVSSSNPELYAGERRKWTTDATFPNRNQTFAVKRPTQTRKRSSPPPSNRYYWFMLTTCCGRFCEFRSTCATLYVLPAFVWKLLWVIYSSILNVSQYDVLFNVLLLIWVTFESNSLYWFSLFVVVILFAFICSSISNVSQYDVCF